MILYQGTAKEYSDQVETNQLVDKIEDAFRTKLGRSLPKNEKSAYVNSLSAMERIVRRSKVPEDCGVLIEYVIPLTSNRIDFLISGEDEAGNKNFIIVELKQWQDARSTSSDGVIETFLAGSIRETTHPSYQAHSYMLYMSDFNDNIARKKINPYACAYLHNYLEKNPEPLMEKVYEEQINNAPLYFKDDTERLQDFIYKYVGKGNGAEILYQIENGDIKPSKKLIDHVSGLLEGNCEFILLDEQKVAFEKAKLIANNKSEKSVVIINGGPGTGKSVLSVNLLGQLLKDKLNAIFVAPNAAFRSVLVARLAQDHPRTRVQNLFKGSSGFLDSDPNTFDVLIVDEAHRLKNQGAYMYMGENQIEDIVRASKTSIFLIDDNQAIRPDDIGSVAEIKRVASKYNAEVSEINLTAQFRCAGAEGYINWLSDVLHIDNTANYDGWSDKDFEFKIFENPNELRTKILSKHNQGFKSRILAGYSWKWTAAKDGNQNSQIADVKIPEFDFSMPWNSRKVGSTWAIDQEGINQVGCVHTSQGIDFDYVGVIVGKDLSFDSEKLSYKTDYQHYQDAMGKRGMKNKSAELNLLIRRIYKILMTRPTKGCYVYFMDKDVERYFKSRLLKSSSNIIKERMVEL